MEELLKKLAQEPTTLNERLIPDGLLHYVPIEEKRKTLDQLFEKWETKNFSYVAYGSCLFGHLELICTTEKGEQIVRTGSGSIRANFSSKNDVYVESLLPLLQSKCLGNACVSLGKKMGRGLEVVPNVKESTSLEQVQEEVKNFTKASEIANYLNSHPCLLYTSPSPRDRTRSRMPSSA